MNEIHLDIKSDIRKIKPSLNKQFEASSLRKKEEHYLQVRA